MSESFPVGARLRGLLCDKWPRMPVKTAASKSMSFIIVSASFSYENLTMFSGFRSAAARCEVLQCSTDTCMARTSMNKVMLVEKADCLGHFMSVVPSLVGVDTKLNHSAKAVSTTAFA